MKNTHTFIRKIFAVLLLCTIELVSFHPIVLAQSIEISTPSGLFIQSASPSATPIITTTPEHIPSPISPTPSPSLQPDLITPTPSKDQKSASIRLPARVHAIQKHQFMARESIDITVESENPDSVLVETVGPNGSIQLPVQRTPMPGGIKLSVEPPSDFVPGKYTITISDSLGSHTTQEFLWGVLAINTNKSIYKPNENANISIAVLDELGRMICDAEVSLFITSPSGIQSTHTTLDGSIIVNDACKSHEVTNLADYEAHFLTKETGMHTLTLSAKTKNGTHTLTDAFEVRDTVLFDVERDSATRIYPKNTYPVRITITATSDFTGTITESVPESFTISPLESVASYSAIRVGFAPTTSPKNPPIQLHYPFENTFERSLEFGTDVKDPKLKEQYRSFGLSGHDGTDFALPEGTPVLATDTGLVLLAGDGVYGTTIAIQHTWGRSYYGHLQSVAVSPGDRVITGQLIGHSGQTGLTTGPHLHFGIRPRGKDAHNGYFGKIDPTPYFNLPLAESESPHSLVSWNVAMKKGQTITIGYQYKAPLISPKLYRAGPLRFTDTPIHIDSSIPSDTLLYSENINDTIASESPSLPLQKASILFEETRQWQIAADATFQMQTGYYIGTGTDNFAITGVGFQPELVLIKDDTGNGVDGVNWKSSVMTSEISSTLADNDADTANDAIQSLDSDGFTLGTDADVNTANIRFVWIAFRGSDCTSTGTFCVGSYTGDGATSHAVSTGFQPNFVSIKRNGLSVGTFQTSSMAADVSQTYDANNEVTNGTGIRTLDATGFTVGSGARVNTTNDNYWFYAFKSTSNAFAVGTYTGNGSSQSITVGFQPQYAMVKIANATAAAPAVFNQTESGTDYTNYISDLSNATNLITTLSSNGFSVGSDSRVNENTKTLYWIAFGGASAPSASGTYTLKVGSYTGNGTSQSISSVGFAPDLVLIKDESGANYGVFRTKLMKGNTTGYLSNAAVNFAGAITSLDSDGFSVGSDATVNTNATVYHYQAFGNAYNPETNTGSADFTIGAHTGSGGDSRNILRLPFQPNLVAGKTNGTVAGAWRTSAESGDLSLPFDNVAESADIIQALNSDGFQVGTSVRMNSSGNVNFWFAFKTSSAMTVNSYAGTGSAQDVTTPGYNPNLVWIKSASTTYAVCRPSTITGDSTQYFTNSAAVSDRITGFISTGFSIGGNQPQTNTASTTYHYATWLIPVSGPTNDQLMRHGNWFTSGGVEQSFTF